MNLIWQGPARQSGLEDLGHSVSEAIPRTVSDSYGSSPELISLPFVPKGGVAPDGFGVKSESEPGSRDRSYSSYVYLREALPSVFATSNVAPAPVIPSFVSGASSYRASMSPAMLMVASLAVEYVNATPSTPGQVLTLGSVTFGEIAPSSLAGNFLDKDVPFFNLEPQISPERITVFDANVPTLASPLVFDSEAPQPFRAEGQLSFVERVVETLKESYVTLIDQLKVYASFGEQQLNNFAGGLSSVSSPLFDLIDSLPRGPRTPLLNIEEYNLGIGGDDNSADFGYLSELSFFASLSRKGDPGESSPDDNDLPGQLNIEIFGLDVGANFQNGVYIGGYRQESDGVEGHRQFQTGMIDQSGAYINDQRFEALDIIALNPEAPGQSGLLSMLGSDWSVEGLSDFLARASESDSIKNEVDQDSAAVDQEMSTYDYGSTGLFDTANLEIDPGFLGGFFDSLGSEELRAEDLSAIAAPISASSSYSEELIDSSTLLAA